MDNNSLYPIYEILHVPFWKTKAFLISVSIVGFALFLFFLWFGIKKIRRNGYKKKQSWDIAFDEFSQIGKQLEALAISSKSFYFKLTWAFKRYLHGRYGFDVYGKTDGELFLYLEGIGFPAVLIQDLQIIFEGSSTIKFANEQAVLERMKRDLDLSVEFIKKTMPTVGKTAG